MELTAGKITLDTLKQLKALLDRDDLKPKTRKSLNAHFDFVILCLEKIMYEKIPEWKAEGSIK